MTKESDIISLKLSLDKKLEKGATSSEIEDVLNALREAPMNYDILLNTKVGKSVAHVLKSFPKSTTTGLLAENLITNWKAVASRDKPRKKEETVSAVADVGSEISGDSLQRTPSNSVLRIKRGNSSPRITVSIGRVVQAAARLSLAPALPQPQQPPQGRAVPGPTDPNRKKVVTLFAERLKQYCDGDENAQSLAVQIEGSINALHNSGGNEKDKTAYQTKARSLAFNLKKNEKLCKAIALGAVAPDIAVILGQENLLASSPRRREMEKLRKEADEARRTDYNQAVREERCKALGINPNAVGGFKCEKCEGEKTSHTQVQLERGDEPMAVFLTCLTCGHQWRE